MGKVGLWAYLSCMQTLVKLYRYINYHFFEVKAKPSTSKYRLWALKRLLGNITHSKTSNLHNLLPEDMYIQNRYGQFYIPRMSDVVYSVSSAVESNLIPHFQMPTNTLFLDIGANAGKYSIMLANSVQNSQIYSFEPSPSTFKILKKNIELNKLEQQVKAFNFGLSDQNGAMTFAMSQIFSGVSHIVDTATGQYDNLSYEQVKVQIKTLDDVIREEGITTEAVRLIKIDVEGHEYNVLKGAHKTLLTLTEGARLIVEIHPDKQRVDAITAYLDKLSFDCYQIDNENFVFTKR